MKNALCLLALSALLLLATTALAFDVHYAKKLAKDAQEGQRLNAQQKAIIEEYELRFGGEVGTDRVGGPDTYGYTFRDSDEEDGPDYSWVDISTAGTEITGLGDTDSDGPFPLGINFPFYGTYYDEFWISSDGMINFDGVGIATLSNNELPNTNGPGNLIAWFWDDMHPGYENSGTTYYANTTIDGEDVFVISFIDWREYDNSGVVPDNALTAQIILFDDGRILINYDYLGTSLDLTSFTLGIEDPTEEIGITYCYNNADNAPGVDDFSVMFYMPVPDADISGTIIDGLTNSGIEGATVTVGVLSTTTDASGNYQFDQMLIADETYRQIITADGYASQVAEITPVSGVNDFDYSLFELPDPNTTNYQTNFEDNQGPFTTNSLPEDDAWEYGTPTIDPNGTISGVNAWSINLDGDYTTYANDTLITTESWEIQSTLAQLQYFHWYEYEDECDGYKVLISTDGGVIWEELIPEGGYPVDEITGLEDGQGFSDDQLSWQPAIFPLDDYVGQQVWFAFWHGTDLSVNNSGVTIDNLTINVGATDASLSGTVLEHETGNPLEGATVTLGDWTTTTDANGNYNIDETASSVILPFSAELDGYFSHEINLMLIAGANTHNVNLVPHPPAVEDNFFTDFEASDAPFVVGAEPGDDAWEWGIPTVEPDAAYSGSNVWAINLDGEYINGADDTLFTVDSWLIDNDSAFLHYYHWYEFEGTPDDFAYDGYQVLVSSDMGESWELLVPDGGYNDQDISGLDSTPGFTSDQLEWVEVNYSLAGYVGESIKFAFRCGTDVSGLRSGVSIDDLTINVGFNIPEVTIEEAHFNDALLESFIQVTGIVVQGSGTTTTNRTEVYIQDASGWGIQLYDAELIEGYDRGDELQVVGRLTEVSDTRRIVNFEITELSTGNDLPAPYIGTTVELRNVTAFEGRWVQASGFIQNPDPYEPSVTLFIDDGTVEDGTGELQVRVWSPTGIDLSAYEQYDCITVRGVVNLSNDAIQIEPSAQEDIELASPFGAPVNLNAVYDADNNVVNLSWTGVDELDETFETFRYFAVYRNNVMIGTVSEGTTFDDYFFDYGDVFYNVSAFYDVGESEWSNTMDVTLTHPLWAPVELEFDLNQQNGDVEITWDAGGDHGEGVETLEYNAGTPAGSYIWPGATMATKMTVDEEAQLLGVWFATTGATGPREFNVEIYNWDNNNDNPMPDPEFTTSSQGALGYWVQVDLSEENIIVNFDFVVGFGSIDNSVGLIYDPEDLDFERAWDRTNTGWAQSFEPYYIRAIVRYTDGTLAQIGPMGSGNPIEMTDEVYEERQSLNIPIVTDELDDLVEYTVYRDDEVQGNTFDRIWADSFTEYGTYSYTVVANYDEGDSDASDPLTINWSSVDERFDGIPEEFAIETAYPNPFNPTVNVVVAVPELAKVDAVIYDVLGRHVATINREQLKPGYHTFNWTAHGSSGIYFLRVSSDQGWTEMRKLIYMK